MSLDLQLVRQLAEDTARQAGAKLLEYFEKPMLQKSLKDEHFDLVTEADKASEALILATLTTAYPTHHFVGEEGGGTGADRETAPYRWYIDPLDGTVNFASTLPIFAVSLALTDAENNPLVGVVYNPANGEMFSAVKGHGATFNGQALHVSQNTALKTSVLASGFPYSKAVDPDNNTPQYAYFEVRTRGLRRLGSAALDLCFVAKGRFDGYWEMRLNRWDYLAGLLCVQEAGGVVTDYRGEQGAHIYRQPAHIVATNGHIHAEVLQGLKDSHAPQAL